MIGPTVDVTHTYRNSAWTSSSQPKADFPVRNLFPIQRDRGFDAKAYSPEIDSNDPHYNDILHAQLPLLEKKLISELLNPSYVNSWDCLKQNIESEIEVYKEINADTNSLDICNLMVCLGS